MRRKWLPAALLLVAAVGSSGAVGSASTGPATIRITDRQVMDVYLGTGVGEREVVRTTLYDRSGSRKAIGQAAMLCTYFSKRLRSCTITFALPKGTLVASGLLSTRLIYELAIVGGTGLYDNARGTLTTTVIRLRPRRDLLLFRLTG
jgi:hypothetical protein